MKGLLLNSFYSSIGNIKLFLLLVVALGVTVLITGNQTAQELFVYITITAFSINAVVSLRKDSVSKWNKFELTLPVRRKAIIQCKFASYIIWVIAGVAIALAVSFLAISIHKNSQMTLMMDSYLSMFTLGIGISLLTGSFFYPISYIVGMDKSETTLIVSVILAIILTVGSLKVLNGFIFSFNIRMLLFVMFYLIIFVASYALTLLIYLSKEF